MACPGSNTDCYKYTYSNTLDVRSYDPTFTTVATDSSQSAAGTPFDYHNPRLNYAPSDLDNTHVLNGVALIAINSESNTPRPHPRPGPATEDGAGRGCLTAF